MIKKPLHWLPINFDFIKGSLFFRHLVFTDMIVYNTFILLHTIHMNSSLIMAICIFCHVLSTNSTLYIYIQKSTKVNF